MAADAKGRIMAIKFTTRGNARGGCGHNHRTLLAAEMCLQREKRSCAIPDVGSYSDRVIFVVEDNGDRRRLNDDERVELIGIRYDIERGAL